VEAHQPGEHHAEGDGGQCQTVILQTDYFMVQAEHVLAEKALRRRVNVGLDW
jgi:hypothetical protein